MGFLRGLLTLTVISFLFVVIASIVTLTIAITVLIGVIIYVLLNKDKWKNKDSEMYDGY